MAYIDDHERERRALEKENRALKKSLSRQTERVSLAERRAVLAEQSARTAWALALKPPRRPNGDDAA